MTKGDVVTVLTFLFGLFTISIEEVITIPTLAGMKGSKVTLECKYRSTERWYLIQWKRRIPGEDDVTITTLQNMGRSDTMPIWEDIVNVSLRTRARTNVYIDVNAVDFDLSITNFTCNDTGTYMCEVITANSFQNATNLTITAKPGTPTVINDEIILEENDTYTLECSAMAGIPVADIKWYYKRPDSKDFVHTDVKTKNEIVKLNDCSQKAIQRMNVAINQDTDGIIYRCQVESDLLEDQEKQRFTDDVVLKLPRKEIIQKQPQYNLPTPKPTDTNKSRCIHSCTAYLFIIVAFQYILLVFH